MTKDEKKLRIDQLRKDKIIYAVEATAVSAISLLTFQFSIMYFEEFLQP